MVSESEVTNRLECLTDGSSLPDATILNSTETAEAGVAIVDDAQQTLKRLFSTIAAWNDITELVERVDWEDVQLLNLVAANQACYHSDDDRSVPLLAMIIRLEEYEQDSMGRMRFLFNEWWTEGQSHVSLVSISYPPFTRMLTQVASVASSQNVTEHSPRAVGARATGHESGSNVAI